MKPGHGKAVDQVLEIHHAIEKNLSNIPLDLVAKLAAAVYIGTALNRVADTLAKRGAD